MILVECNNKLQSTAKSLLGKDFLKSNLKLLLSFYTSTDNNYDVIYWSYFFILMYYTSVILFKHENNTQIVIAKSSQNDFPRDETEILVGVAKTFLLLTYW